MICNGRKKMSIANLALLNRKQCKSVAEKKLRVKRKKMFLSFREYWS